MRYQICIVILIFTFSASYSQNRSLEFFAKDLSEDATVMSSYNDELVLLIYDLKDTSNLLSTPLFGNSFELDTLVRSKTFNELLLNNQSYLLFLIENDDNRSVQQIDPVLRVYWKTIITLVNGKKDVELSTYLGDNDLLGYITFDLNIKGTYLEIKGRQSLDAYHYLIKIK